MTNVRVLQSILRCCQPSAAVSDKRRNGSGHQTNLRASRGIVLLAILLMLQASTCPATAQIPSGSAGGAIVDTNRRGLGISVRGGHVAGDTVGRDDSASLFNLSPYINVGNGMLFGDARVVYGNDGGLAYSFGGGYRHYIPAWDAVAGANIFSDRDSISGTHFRSWGVGGELLANGWEIRANAYSPYHTKSVHTGVRADSSSAVFVGNNVEFSRIDSFLEALHGFDAEIGWLLPGRFAERFDVRLFGGGYQYKGEGVPSFSGFSTRLQTDIGDRLELGLKLADDEVFHTTLAFSAIVHFGAFESQDYTRRSAIQRMAEPVRRNLNIAAVATDIVTPGQIAQAQDGTNLTIIHVNSNAAPGGTGTVDNPFDMLSTGLAFNHPEVSDVVFVHAGSQFSDAANNSVTLDPFQSVFGEGLIRVEQTGQGGALEFVRNRQVLNIVDLTGIGELILPDSPTFTTSLATYNGLPEGTPLTPGVTRPILTGAAGNSLTMSTSSRASGLILANAIGHGISVPGAPGTDIRDILVQDAFGSGISITNTPVFSTTTITNTEIINSAGVAPAFEVVGGGGTVSYVSDGLSTDPPLGTINNTAAGAPVVSITGRVGGLVNMESAAITDVGGAGIIIADNSNTSLETPFLDIIVDNVSLDSSTGTGIAITNGLGLLTGSERYIIRNTSDPTNALGNPHIQNATNSSILVSNIPDGSQVRFLDVLQINTPQGAAIDIDNLGGDVLFNQNVTIGPPAAGGSPAVTVTNSQATGDVQFSRDVTIGGAAAPAPAFAQGIVLDSNAAGSTFTIFGDTLIGTTSTDGIAITSNDSIVNFGQAVTINDRVGNGIRIFDSSGEITFGTNEQQTTINNAVPSDLSGLIVDSSEAQIHFEHLNVQDAQVAPAVSLTNNLPGVTGRTPGTAVISFNNMTIASTAVQPSPGLFGTDNELIIVRNLPSQTGVVTTSTIQANDAPAVDITDSGIDITLERVESIDSPTFGIGLVRTNMEPTLASPGQIRKRFRVLGGINNAPGSGGLIQGAGTPAGSDPLTSAGVFLENGGQVQLDHMVLDGNNHGILVQNSGLVFEEDQFLELANIQVIESLRHGIRATNLHRLTISENSLFSDNGLAPRVLGDQLRETILLDYTENPLVTTVPPTSTTLFDDYDNPFEVLIFDNDAANVAAFFTERDDAIRIFNSGAGTEAHIDVLIEDTGFQIGDAFDFFSGEGERAVVFNWEGVARVEFSDNAVLLDGVNRVIAPDTDPGFQDAFVVDVSSRTDELLLTVARNFISSTIQEDSTGLRLTTAGPVTASISGNTMLFNGENSTGGIFRLARNEASRFVRILNNDIIFAPALAAGRGSDGGVGLDFDRVQEITNLEIAGNNISLFDADPANADSVNINGEAGILFGTVIGPVTLRGRVNNAITLNGIAIGDIDSIFNLQPGQANGSIVVNGVLVP